MSDSTRKVGQDAFRIEDRPRPGDLGTMVALQAGFYARSHGFGLPFEVKVAREMAAFLHRYDGDRDLFLTVRRADCLCGGLTLDATAPDDGPWAHLRWVFLTPEARGHGLAAWLLTRAIDQARALGKAGVYLTTIADLPAAERLYRAAGFVETARQTGETWGRAITEIRMDLVF